MKFHPRTASTAEFLAESKEKFARKSTMRSDASAPAREGDVDLADIGEYDEMLDVLDTLLDEALRKVESGRVYDAEAERVRIKWIRIAKDIVAEKRKVKSERDIEELHQELADLKADRGDDQ